jgi:DNA-binding transcriptional LysR family regulator
MPAARELSAATWIVREKGSGTRAVLDRYLASRGVDSKAITIALELPSNEAVLAAVIAGGGITVLSESVCADSIETGHVARLTADLEVRPFYVVQHADRYRSRAVRALLEVIRDNQLTTSDGRRRA